MTNMTNMTIMTNIIRNGVMKNIRIQNFNLSSLTILISTTNFKL